MTKEKKPFDWNGPNLLYNHIISNINIDTYNLKEQLYREIAHELFLVVSSQFNRKENYQTIVGDINKNMKEYIYVNCIKKAKFKSLKGKISVFALQHKLNWLIFIYVYLKH